MRKISSFTFISLNGYYKSLNDDISWHHHEEEAAQFSEEQLESENILLFGRKTYEMMSSFWPGEYAKTHFPKVAEGMNKAEKWVLSRSLKTTDWNHTKILHQDAIHQLKEIKNTSGKDISILGSGEVLKQLAELNLIDEFKVLIDPVVLRNGVPVFHEILQDIKLCLLESKVFRSGAILLRYSPIKE